MAKSKHSGGEYYRYESGRYLREKLGSKRGCESYRTKTVKPGRKLLLCIQEGEGPRGGRTKAIALLRTKQTPKGAAHWRNARIKHMKRD